jgi:hypothetical protein
LGDRRAFGPGRFIGPGLFAAMDTDKDGTLTRTELKGTFEKWASEWDSDKSGSLDEDKLRQGLMAALPRPNLGGPMGPGGGGRGGPDQAGNRRGQGGPGGMGFGRRGGPGFGGGMSVRGVELDPLIAADDPSKPHISKLLAVPSLRTRYLGYVRDIADQWLDWNKVGPIAQQYHSLIAEDVKSDTRKLDSTDDFLASLSDRTQENNPGGFGRRRAISLKTFFEQRRAFLLKYTEPKKAGS